LPGLATGRLDVVPGLFASSVVGFPEPAKNDQQPTTAPITDFHCIRPLYEQALIVALFEENRKIVNKFGFFKKEWGGLWSSGYLGYGVIIWRITCVFAWVCCLALVMTSGICRRKTDSPLFSFNHLFKKNTASFAQKPSPPIPPHRLQKHSRKNANRIGCAD
jgi:hypothetical protein